MLSWALLTGAVVNATVVALGTIEQPVNLCAAADPSRIPLGPVVVESNHGYGVHDVIVAPRPCQHGAMSWRGGVELNQNLASAFGISLEIDDDTQIHEGTVRLVLKNQARPAYSPYQREQVVAATLHCLLRSVHATPKSPLRVQIISENPRDQKWIKRYPTEFINRPDREGDFIDPTKIPDTEIQVDEYGVASVVFPRIKPVSPIKALRPVLLPIALQGGDVEDPPIAMIPVWVGDTEGHAYNAIGRAYHLYYDRFNQATPLLQQLHALHQDRLPVHWSVRESEEQTTLTCHFANQSQQAVSAALYAAILTIRPTVQKPLVVEMHALTENIPLFHPFESRGGWKRVAEGEKSYIQTTFVLGANGTLTAGSLPNCELEKTAGGPYVMHFTPENQPVLELFEEPREQAKIDPAAMPSAQAVKILEKAEKAENARQALQELMRPVAPPNPLLEHFADPAAE